MIVDIYNIHVQVFGSFEDSALKKLADVNIENTSQHVCEIPSALLFNPDRSDSESDRPFLQVLSTRPSMPGIYTRSKLLSPRCRAWPGI